MEPLTHRERQVLAVLARSGAETQEIARELNISYATACRYLQIVFQKIHARNRTEAALWARDNGVVATPPAPVS